MKTFSQWWLKAKQNVRDPNPTLLLKGPEPGWAPLINLAHTKSQLF